MKQQDKAKVGRRDFLRAVGAGAGVAATAPLATQAVAAENDTEKKKARYNPNSEEVKTFYRVNRYLGS
jgi:hypothetical protein